MKRKWEYENQDNVLVSERHFLLLCFQEIRLGSLLKYIKKATIKNLQLANSKHLKNVNQKFFNVTRRFPVYANVG